MGRKRRPALSAPPLHPTTFVSPCSDGTIPKQLGLVRVVDQVGQERPLELFHLECGLERVQVRPPPSAFHRARQTPADTSCACRKVKASDLNFQNTASPNSRLMTLSPEGSAVPLARARSISSSSSTKGPAQVAPRPVERQQSSNGTNGAAIAKEAKAPTPKVTAPKPAAASSESEESEESEEDVSEDEKPVPKKLAPIVAQRASTAEAKAAAARVKKAAPVTKAPVVAAARRTASPVSIESESESESEESASESDESESDESEDARPAKKGVKKPVRKLSRAAALAAHAMDVSSFLHLPCRSAS